MKVDIPEVKRCCFCIPLRYGVMALGILKILLTLLYLTFNISNLVVMTGVVHDTMMEYFIIDIIVRSILCACLILDVCGTLIFLVGGCLKNERILHMYYIYISIVMLCTLGLFFLWLNGQDMVLVGKIAQLIPGGFQIFVSIFRGMILMGICLFGFQTYLIILTKNELEKLKNKRMSYRFTNTTIEETNEMNSESTVGTSPTYVASPYNSMDNQFISVVNEPSNSRLNVKCNELHDENVEVY